MTLAERPHPFPSRTRKSSSPAPKILRGQPFGKIGRRQDFCVSGASRRSAAVRPRASGHRRLRRPRRPRPVSCAPMTAVEPASAHPPPRPPMRTAGAAPTPATRSARILAVGRRRLAEPTPSRDHRCGAVDAAGPAGRREAAPAVPDRRPRRAARPTSAARARPRPIAPGRAGDAAAGRSPGRRRSSSTTAGVASTVPALPVRSGAGQARARRS